MEVTTYDTCETRCWSNVGSVIYVEGMVYKNDKDSPAALYFNNTGKSVYFTLAFLMTIISCPSQSPIPFFLEEMSVCVSPVYHFVLSVCVPRLARLAEVSTELSRLRRAAGTCLHETDRRDVTLSHRDGRDEARRHRRC